MDLNTQQDVHLSHYWNVIRKRWKIAAAILLVVMTGTFLASYFSKPLYRARIQIAIEPESNAMTLADLFGVPASEQEFLQTQYVLLKSRGLALRTVEDHKLYNDPEIYPPGVAGKTPQELERIKEGIAAGLIGGIDVVPVRNTWLVDIFYVGGSPRVAQKVAEAWGDSFMRMNIAKKLDSVQQASEFLTRQISAVQADLELSRQQLQQYGQQRGIISVGEGENDNVVMQKLTQLNTEVTGAEGIVFEKQAALNALQRTSPDAVASTDPLVISLTQSLSNLQREYSEKRSQYLEGHQVMRQLADQIEKARIAKDNAVRNAYSKAVEAARAELASAAARANSTRAAYNQQRNDAQRLNVDAARYLDLKMNVDTKAATLATLQKQLSETEVAARLRGASTSNIHWVDHADMPGGRYNLSMRKNLQSAFPLGLILGFAAIFFLEYMDRSVKTPEELERVTGYASLGVIPAASSMAARGSGYS
ncbi:MAG: GumC family protein, partial [Thermoanaerobaculia bacterium]